MLRVINATPITEWDMSWAFGILNRLVWDFVGDYGGFSRFVFFVIGVFPRNQVARIIKGGSK